MKKYNLLSPKSGESESSNAVYRIYEMSMSMVTGAFYMNNWLGPISDLGLECPDLMCPNTGLHMKSTFVPIGSVWLCYCLFLGTHSFGKMRRFRNELISTLMHLNKCFDNYQLQSVFPCRIILSSNLSSDNINVSVKNNFLPKSSSGSWKRIRPLYLSDFPNQG